MVAFIEQFVFRFVLHHETDKQRGAECSQHKQDVAADVVKSIENIFAEHGNVFPRTIAQNGRNVAEDEDSSQHNRNRGGTADFGFFLNGRNQHFINGQRGRQRGNQEQREENHGEHRSRPHIREHNRQALEHQSRAGIGRDAEAEERRENHKARKYGDDGIGNCGNDCGLHQIFVFIQIAGQVIITPKPKLRAKNTCPKTKTKSSAVILLKSGFR